MGDQLREDIPILFEDDHLIVLNKPSGLLSIEDGYNPALPNLRGMLNAKYGRIWAVHRLDKLASGVILFAKDAPTHKELNGYFLSREVKKTYRAIVHGYPGWDQKLINLPLKIDGDRRHRTIVNLKTGKEALTEIRVTKRSKQFAHFKIQPLTGYTHQIRAHCAAIGHPILGDRLYFRACEIQDLPILEAIYLHAQKTAIPDQKTGEIRAFIAPLPDYFDL